MQRFQDIPSLTQWLIEVGVDLSKWSDQNTKGVADLFEEIQAGEIGLLANPPRRLVSVVCLNIYQDGLQLKQRRPELANDHPRKLQRLSEKLKPGETTREAALRGIYEELGGIYAQKAEILAAAESPTVHSEPSGSYPGLETRYSIYDVDVRIPRLPETNFTTEEGGLLHEWFWCPPSD